MYQDIFFLYSVFLDCGKYRSFFATIFVNVINFELDIGISISFLSLSLFFTEAVSRYTWLIFQSNFFFFFFQEASYNKKVILLRSCRWNG